MPLPPLRALSRSVLSLSPSLPLSLRPLSTQSPQFADLPVPAVPPMPALNPAHLATAAAVLRPCARLLAITGAGVSTSSGIPDYRSPHRPPYNPLRHSQFMESAAVRRRYWARSFVGYRRMNVARPNAAHFALLELERMGRLTAVITQNVDRLHQTAGQHNILELHGTIHDVECLACKATYSRTRVQRFMAKDNARWLQRHSHSTVVRPDGDADIPEEAYEEFVTPGCPMCGAAMLKPLVVFHGGSIPRSTSEYALSLADGCDAMLVAGSSLSTWSALRLAKRVAEAGKPVVLFVHGPTRADDFATMKVDGPVTDALTALVENLKA